MSWTPGRCGSSSSPERRWSRTGNGCTLWAPRCVTCRLRSSSLSGGTAGATSPRSRRIGVRDAACSAAACPRIGARARPQPLVARSAPPPRHPHRRRPSRLRRPRRPRRRGHRLRRSIPRRRRSSASAATYPMAASNGSPISVGSPTATTSTARRRSGSVRSPAPRPTRRCLTYAVVVDDAQCERRRDRAPRVRRLARHATVRHRVRRATRPVARSVPDGCAATSTSRSTVRTPTETAQRCTPPSRSTPNRWLRSRTARRTTLTNPARRDRGLLRAAQLRGDPADARPGRPR